MLIAHVAFDLSLRSKGRDRINNNHIQGTGTNKHVGNFESLFAGIGLRNQQFIDIDADGTGVGGIHGMLGIDVGTDATVALCLGHHMDSKSGLT